MVLLEIVRLELKVAIIENRRDDALLLNKILKRCEADTHWKSYRCTRGDYMLKRRRSFCFVAFKPVFDFINKLKLHINVW